MQQSSRRDLTFRANLRATRYGWLRLTPAYSVHLVRELLDAEPRADGPVLDPFCGTGTTALVCAERGIEADTTDINPFLLWLTRTKTRRYDREARAAFSARALRVATAIESSRARAPFTPNLHQIEKWWSPAALTGLGRAFGAIDAAAARESEPVLDLLKVAFCQTLIACANVSFGHQSMSFKRPGAAAPPGVVEAWRAAVGHISEGASTSIERVPATIRCDARQLDGCLTRERYAAVITSPPYPNRMSYIRELRPYMYWLRYLGEGREAGELDWQAIGGTWGTATSRVAKWSPPPGSEIPYPEFQRIVSAIAAKSPVLGRYVEKYFHDIVLHARAVFPVVRGGGSAHYIVGNSKFYDVVLPVERILESVLESAGFSAVSSRVIRKRTSKKELYEYVVSARKPAAGSAPPSRQEAGKLRVSRAAGS